MYFAAPELLNAKPYTGPEVDVWSFGIVLYVLVCGKVPFDDQNMPALHAKIKRGVVEYPNWLSAECKHLISRMLVVEPTKRAAMAEIINHPWMLKGYDAPLDSFTMPRSPIRAPLDPQVIQGMTGFEFGDADKIESELHQVLQSEEYTRALHIYELRKNQKAILDETDTADRNSEYVDPTVAFHPLLSIYYLVREKQQRDRRMRDPSSNLLEAQQQPNLHVPEIPVPALVHPSETSYDVDQSSTASTRSSARVRSRTHGEVEVRQAIEQLAIAVPPPPATPEPRKGIFRRLSSRRTQNAEKMLNVPTSATNVGAPAAPEITTPRKSLSGRRSRDNPENYERVQPSQQSSTNVSVPHQGVATNQSRAAESTKQNIGRAASVSEARRNTGMVNRKPVIGLDTIAREDAGTGLGTTLEDGSGSFVAKAQRAKSLGAARGEHIRARREAEQVFGTTNQPNTPAKPSVGGDDSVQKAGLKGLFSVSTTSSKSPQVIHADLLRTLDKLGIRHNDVKGGYNCLYQPSIDLNSIAEGAGHNTITLPSSPPPATGLARTFSRVSRKPSFRRPGRARAVSNTGGADAADESTESVFESSGAQDQASEMSVRFDIYIVKVPWFSLHGVQFKRVSGNSWQYKSLASKILSELNL